MKKILAAALAVLLCIPIARAEVAGAPKTECGGAILMEKETGRILYAENEHTQFEPASVTKVMTLLLIMEALDSGTLKVDEAVNISANAAGMGGSQVYLKEGERFSADDLLKAIAVVSGNDASVAMAEHIAGSEEGFVARMNARAAELGMKDTVFLNCTGLPADGHLTSAHDIAVMSRELMLRHPGIRKYTTIWMDTLRDGAFGLANTNKLVRFYDGTTGLKTGSTDAALYCLSATAERDGMELIAVVLKSPSSDKRFESAKAMLNFGFANYALIDVYPDRALPVVDVLLGQTKQVQPVLAKSSRILVEKTQKTGVTTNINLCENVEAPVDKGQKLGEMQVMVDGAVVETIPILAAESIERLTFWGIFQNFLARLFIAA